jgi:hypothetical protein
MSGRNIPVITKRSKLPALSPILTVLFDSRPELRRDGEPGDAVTVESELIVQVHDVAGKVSLEPVTNEPSVNAGGLNSKEQPRVFVFGVGLRPPLTNLFRAHPFLILIVRDGIIREGRRSGVDVVAIVGILISLNHVRKRFE